MQDFSLGGGAKPVGSGAVIPNEDVFLLKHFKTKELGPDWGGEEGRAAFTKFGQNSI